MAAVLLIIAGICLAFDLPVRPWALLSITAIAAMAAFLLRDRTLIASPLIAIALITFGSAIGQAGFYRYPGNDISAFSSAQPRLTQLELRIDDPPRLVSSAAGGHPLPPKQIMVASVRRILTTHGWISAEGNILVQVSHPHPFLAAGQRVRVLGMLGRPAHATNPGEFDAADYYRQQRILTLMRISRIQDIEILSDNGPGLIGQMRASARDLLAMGFTDKHAADHALLRALVLGDADPMMRESQQQFQKIGVAYLFTISGIHIAVVAAFVYGICRLLMRSPRMACWLCLMIVILYGIIALPHESALRAVVLCTAVLVGILTGRNPDKLQLLSIVAGILLVLNPMELFSPGFQLGFICILGLILLGQPLLRWLANRDREETGSAYEQPKALRWKAWFFLRNWLAISLIAWAVSLPITAYNFGQLSPWTIPSGVLLFPIVTIALLGGCAKIILTLAWPSLAGLWAHLAGIPIVQMRHLAAALAHLPAASMPVTQPSLALIAIYYILLSLPLFPWPRKRFRQAASALATAAVCGLVVCLSLGMTAAQLPTPADAVSITFLDIGAGQCSVLQAPHALPAMIDAGSSTISDVTRSCLGPFLIEHGDRTIGTVLLSHSDYDHISAIQTALPIFGVSAIYTSRYFAHFASIDPPAQALLDQLTRAGKSPHLIQRGDHVQLTNDITIDVLWPPPACDFNCNNTGLVLKLSCGGRTVLFPADIQVDAMRELLKSPAQLKADVLVAPHHGSSEVTTPAFVRAVDPQFIISSNGSPLTEKQKAFEKMIGHRPLYRTSNCGAITLHIAKNGTVTVETFLPRRVSG